MLDGAFVFLSAYALFLRTLCPTIASGDTGEFALAALHLDVTHPPGYPGLVCLLRLAMLLPAGGVIFRAGLVCAAAGAAAAAGVFGAVRAVTGRRDAAVLAAALLASSPYVWWQSTLLDKYALQLALAALVLRVAMAPGGAAHRPLLAWAIAFTHHSLALFLLPVALAGTWERIGRRMVAGRFLLLTAALAAVPFSLRLIYPAIRSAALNRDPVMQVRAINWGEPYQARAWLDYHRLAYYGTRLWGGGDRVEVPPLRAHPGYYPAQVTWPGLLLGLAGLAMLARRRRWCAAALATSGMLTFWFAVHDPLPPALAPSYHQNAYLILILGAGIAAGAALDRVLRPPAGRLAAVLALLALGGIAAARFPRQDGSLHLGVHDFTAETVAGAPPGAVLMGMFDYDMFALRVFQDVFGQRPDLVPLQAPHRLGAGRFIVRRRYHPWAAAALPGATLHFTDRDRGFVILRRLVEDNRDRLCFAVSALSAPAVPTDLFRPSGCLFVARGGACGPAATPREALRALRAARTRTWFSPGAALGVHRILLETAGEMLWRTAAEVTGPGADGVREVLLRDRARLTPGEPAAWVALGEFAAARGRLPEARAAFEHAIALNPDAPESRWRLVELALTAGARDQAIAALARDLAAPLFADSVTATAAQTRLRTGDLDGALPLARRAFAEAAVGRADALPGNPEFEMRRAFLLGFAADLAPDWALAQAEYGGYLADRARFAEAEICAARLRRLDPSDVRLDLALAVDVLARGVYPEARDRLASVTRRNPAEAGGWFYLGQAELGLARRDAARKAFTRFLALAPAAPEGAEVRSLLAVLGAVP